MLLAQQWKKTLRSRYFSQGIGIKILMGFVILYFGSLFLALGVFMPELLKEVYPQASFITPVFGQFLLYYMLIDLILRFFLQDLNVISIQHYLILPIRKTRVIHFLLRTSVFNFFNILPLLIVVPFAIRGVAPEYGALHALGWFASMCFVIVFDHYLAIYLKRVVVVKSAIVLGFAALVAVLLTGNFMGFINLNGFSGMIFGSIGAYPLIGLIPAAFAILLYWVNFRFLFKNTYLDVWEKKKSSEVNTARFSFLESRGIMGAIIANELKLITRNKRTRNLLIMSALFSLYGLIFYTNKMYNDSNTWLFFVGIFMTGIFMIQYGQFMVAWESSYFDGILTRSYSIEDFYRAKFMLLAVSCVIFYIISIAYVYFGPMAFWLNTAAFIYNIGVNIFIVLYATTYHKKRIDLSRGTAFNYQGTSGIQMLFALPLLFAPILIFKAFEVFGKPYYGLIFLSIIGLLNLAFSKYWFKEIVKNFQEKKYKNAQGFREK